MSDRDRLRLDPDPLYVEPEELERRRGSMVWAVIAVLIVVAAVVLVSLAAERTSAADPPGRTPLESPVAFLHDGYISHVGRGFPLNYLALPVNDSRRPLTVRLCGPADCVTLTQTDYGPDQRIHPDRIADVSAAMFERICGVPASFGLCNGTWTPVSRPRVTLPPTDTQ